MRVMTHKSREFQRVTSQMHVVSVHIACAAWLRLGAHMALGALGGDRGIVARGPKRVGDPLVPPVRVFCVV